MNSYETRDQKWSRLRMKRVGEILGMDFPSKKISKKRKIRKEKHKPVGKNYRPTSTPKFAFCREIGNTISLVSQPKIVKSDVPSETTTKNANPIHDLEKFYREIVMNRAFVEYESETWENFLKKPKSNVQSRHHKISKRTQNSVLENVAENSPIEQLTDSFMSVTKIQGFSWTVDVSSGPLQVTGPVPLPHSHSFCRTKEEDLLPKEKMKIVRDNFIDLGLHQLKNKNPSPNFVPMTLTEPDNQPIPSECNQESLSIAKMIMIPRNEDNSVIPPILMSRPYKVVEKLCPHFFPEDILFFKDFTRLSNNRPKHYLSVDEDISPPDILFQSFGRQTSFSDIGLEFRDDAKIRDDMFAEEIFEVHKEIVEMNDLKEDDDGFVVIPWTKKPTLREVLTSSVCQQKLFAVKNYGLKTESEPQNDEERNQLLQKIDDLTKKINSNDALHHVFLIERAKMYRKLKQLDKATEDISQAIEERPTYLMAYWQQHLVYLLQGNYSEALRELDLLEARDPQAGFTFLSRAEIYKNQQKVQEAIENYTNSFKMGFMQSYALHSKAKLQEELDPLSAIETYFHYISNWGDNEALLSISRLYYSIRNYDDCLQTVQEHARLGLCSSEGYLLKIKSLIHLQRWAEALNSCNAAIRYDPDSSQFYFLSGCILRNVKPGMAYSMLEKARKLDPTNVEIMVAMAYIQMKQNRFDEAALTFEKISKHSQNDLRPLKGMALIYLQKCKYSMALEKFTAMVESDFGNVEAHLGRAHCFTVMNNNERALREYDKIINLFPRNKEAYILRGKILLKMKKLDISASCIKVFVSVFGEDPRIRENSELRAFLGDVDKNEIDEKSFDNMEAYILTANGLMLNRNWEHAVNCLKVAYDLYRDSADKNPKGFAEILKLFGHCHLITGSKKMGRELLSRSIQFNRESYMAHYLYGISIITRQKIPENHFLKALRLKKDFAEAHISLAIYFLHHKRYSKAICHCNEALRTKNTCSYYLLRGVIKCAMNHLELGLEDLDKSISLDHFNFYSLYLKGLCCERLGHINQALSLYSYIIERNFQPLLDRALTQRGMIYYCKKMFDRAFRDLSQIKNSLWAPLICIKCHFRQENYQQAISLASELINQNPALIEGYSSRSIAWFMLKEGLSKAIDDVQMALRLDPQSEVDLTNFAIFLHKSECYGNALRILRELCQHSPICDHARDELSLIYLSLGDHLSAYVELTEAIRINPLPCHFSNRGIINMVLGNPAGAKRDFLGALKLNGDHYEANYNISSVYLHQGMLKEAIKHIQTCLEGNVSNVMAHAKMAIILAKYDRHKMAMRSLEKAALLGKNCQFLDYYRAYLHYQEGKYKEAEIYCNKYLSVFKDDYETINLISLINKARERTKDRLFDYCYETFIKN